MMKLFLGIGTAAMALAVLLGAFGAHMLRNRLTPEMTEIFQTAVSYHFYHAMGLLVVGVAAHFLPVSGWLRGAGWLMAAGILLFSGSLYLLSVTGVRWLGAITPVGGTAFILAWICLLVAVWRS